jgi:hypothetical protein
MGLRNLWLYRRIFAEYSLALRQYLKSYEPSVLQQYLTVIATYGYQPRIIRSDRGKETHLAAEVHFALGRTRQNDPHFKFGDSWFYGTSTGNQRIESWWAQLQKSQLYSWRVRTTPVGTVYANIHRLTSRVSQIAVNMIRAILRTALLCW